MRYRMHPRGWMVVVLVAVLVAARVSGAHPPLHEEGGGEEYLGLLMAFPLEEDALISSGLFLPSTRFPSVQYAGRRFNIGTIKGVNVIYAMTGEQIVNAAITTQILYDAFNVVGVVHYGIVGSTNNSLLIGDVAVPTHVAFTSSWNWKEYESFEDGTKLKFGAYNIPRKGQNLLGEIKFTSVQLYSKGNSMENIFWLPVDPYWFKIATQIKDMDVLQRCVNHTKYCVPYAPKAAIGVRGSTADTYLNNAAYREFLWKKFKVSCTDEESAAIVMTSLSNGKPCIVFRGISDYAGGLSGSRVSISKSMASKLAAINALNVAVEFIEIIGGGAQ